MGNKNSESSGDDGSSMRVQIIRNRSLKRVIYLECGNDFADLLLTLLAVPVGSLLTLISTSDSHTGLGTRPGIFNLHSSLHSLEQSALNVEKTLLTEPETRLTPSFLSIGGSVSHACLNTQCSNKVTLAGKLCGDCECVVYSSCQDCLPSFAPYCQLFLQTPTTSGNRVCGHAAVPVNPVVVLRKSSQPQAGSTLSARATVQQQSDRGFAKDTVTFMIKEDLSILRSSTITSMALLKSCKITSFEDLDTEEIYVGRKEVI